jgi:hypothetical protein
LKREKLERMREDIFNIVHPIFPQIAKKDYEVAKLVKSDEVLPVTLEVPTCVKTYDMTLNQC